MNFMCEVDGEEKVIRFGDILQFYILCTKKPLSIYPHVVSDFYDYRDLTCTFFGKLPYMSFRELNERVKYRGIIYILAVLLPDANGHVVKLVDSYNSTFTGLIDSYSNKYYDTCNLEPGRFYECTFKRFGNKIDLYSISETEFKYYINI